MRQAWENLRLLYTDEYLGAESWMQILARRNNWLYGRAHSPSGLFLIRPQQSTTSDTVIWEGTTYYRAEHPTLNFSARMNLAAGGASGARLQYVNDSDVWTTFTGGADTNTGDRWFTGSENPTFDCSGLSLPSHGCLRLRFILDGTGGASTATVYRAFMSGTTGFESWAAMADWSDTNVPTAAQLNYIRQSQLHLLDCAERPNISEHTSTYQHSQDNAYQCVARGSFRYDGRNRLYMFLYTANMDNAAEHIYVYITDEKYPDSGSRLNGGTPIIALAGDGGDVQQGYNLALSDYSLTLGNYYQIEVGITNTTGTTADYPILGIGGWLICDTGSPTRTYVPATFAEGDVLTHTHLNNISDDLEEMYTGAGTPESPLYSQHWISTHQPTDFGTVDVSASRIRLYHSWRWLRYATTGSVPLYLNTTVTTDDDGNPVIEPDALITLPDTDSEPAIYDLDSVAGLTYGQEYYICDSNANQILWAFEDYNDA